MNAHMAAAPASYVSMLNDDDLDDFILAQKATTTKSKDKSDSRVFARFCQSLNEHRDIAEIPSETLNQLLCNFFVKAVKKDGKEGISIIEK